MLCRHRLSAQDNSSRTSMHKFRCSRSQHKCLRLFARSDWAECRQRQPLLAATTHAHNSTGTLENHPAMPFQCRHSALGNSNPESSRSPPFSCTGRRCSLMGLTLLWLWPQQEAASTTRAGSSRCTQASHHVMLLQCHHLVLGNSNPESSHNLRFASTLSRWPLLDPQSLAPRQCLHHHCRHACPSASVQLSDG